MNSNISLSPHFELSEFTESAIAFDQLIIYPSFIHVSYVRTSRKNRCKLTKAFANGSYAALTRAQALSLE